MMLSAGKVYTTVNPSSLQNYRDFATPPSLDVYGGSVNLFCSNAKLNTDLANPFDLQGDIGNPYTNESVELWPRWKYIGYSVVSGTPLVTVADGVLTEVTDG